MVYMYIYTVYTAAALGIMQLQHRTATALDSKLARHGLLGLCTVTVFTVYTAVFNTAVTVAVVHREGLTVTKHRQNTVRLT
jgi:hypothetical protein